MNSYVVNLHPVPNDSNAGQALQVDNTATQSFANTLDYKTTCCYVTTSGGNAYVTFDGSTPSATNGHLLTAPYMTFWSKDATRLAKFLGTSGTTCHVRMSQFTY